MTTDLGFVILAVVAGLGSVWFLLATPPAPPERHTDVGDEPAVSDDGAVSVEDPAEDPKEEVGRVSPAPAAQSATGRNGGDDRRVTTGRSGQRPT